MNIVITSTFTGGADASCLETDLDAALALPLLPLLELVEGQADDAVVPSARPRRARDISLLVRVLPPPLSLPLPLPLTLPLPLSLPEVSGQSRRVSADEHLVALMACLQRSCAPPAVPRSVPCSTTLHVRHLSVAGTDVTDAALAGVLLGLPCLQVLDVCRCGRLEQEPLAHICQAGDEEALSLREVYIDGCWRMHLDRFLAGGSVPAGVYVDVLMGPPLTPTDAVEVVILSDKHEGSWVRCSIINSTPLTRPRIATSSAGAVTRTPGYSIYNIFVWETLLYDHAIGFSASPVQHIERKHLRRARKICLNMSTENY
jgi:hypothetical protein